MIIYNDFINLEIKKDSKIIIDYYNKINYLFNLIIPFIKNVRRIFQDLNIYNYDHIYKANRITG